MSSEAFDLKYRPRTFDDIVGHEVAVTRLRGMVNSGKYPSALLFTGPSSAGKTTLARALAVAINGKPIEEQKQSYMEMNAGADRSIDDVRELVKISKFQPDGKKRIICIDEAQGLLSNAPATDALLKSLEEPAKNTIWILASMEPSKFKSGKGIAIANRCTQFVLEAHTNQHLLIQAKRIAKGEKMSYVDVDMLKTLVRNSNNMMRTMSGLMKSVQDYWHGLDKADRPDMLTADIIGEVLASTESNDDRLAIQVVVACFAGQYAAAQKALLYVADGFQFGKKLQWLVTFLLNNAVLQGARHPKVWFSSINKDLIAALKAQKIEPTLGQLAAFQAHLIDMQSRMQSFAVGEIELMSVTMYRVIKELHAKEK